MNLKNLNAKYALVNAGFMVLVAGTLGFAYNYLSQSGFSAGTIGTVMSIVSIAGVFIGPAAGDLVDRSEKITQKMFISASMILCAALALVLLVIPQGSVLILPVIIVAFAASTVGMPLLNGIFDICRRGVQLGAQEAFLDCPSREKGQYLGDGTITAHAHLLLTGDARMYKKMLLDFAASARVCPGLMAVAPGNEMQEIADYSCQYPEQIMTYYELTGDIDTVRQLMPVVDALEDYFDRFRTDGGLIENVTEKWNLVDWPANLRDGYDFELSQPIGPGKHNVINAFYYGLKKDADRMRALLALPPRNEAEAVRRAFIAAFRKEDGLFRDAVGSEHTALHSVVLPLYYGITEAEDMAPAVALIRERGLCCGVYMACFVLKALVRNGEYDLMNALLLSEDEHSWGNMLREGATSCWEAWGKDQKWNTSLCHPWASAPIILLMEDVAGIRPEKPGFDGLVQTPHAPESLGDIALSFGTVRGVVHAARRGGQWSLTMA